ncbi:MAG: ZIP family metal transporter [Candidatus Omnitrophota bacterium]|nr:ZIP family metal transporter [Candidatus Omnitrophota bacterium]
MHPLASILISVFIVSAVSLIGIVTFLFKAKPLDKVFFVLVSFATGSLLGAAFLDLLPEALDKIEPSKAFGSVVFGIMLFFLMEKFLYWYHCHKGECDVHQFTYLNLVGDGVHNFLDGVIIAAAFLTSTSAGLIATIAIILHEIPQELGDFGILVYGGFSKGKALMYNFVTALTAFLGAIAAYFFLNKLEGFTPFMISVAAGGFIYIACTDLIPELNKERIASRSIQQFILILLGIGVILAGKIIFR